MKHELESLQMERLGPREIERAWAEVPIAYVPLGSLEWHGHHLPVGLDAIKAHKLCLLAAAQTGGLVLPPLYYGTGGEHLEYRFTVMVEADQIVPLLAKTIERLGDWGVRVAVIFSGHFAGEQVRMIEDFAQRATSDRTRVVSLTDAMLPDPPLAPDHAAIFETSMMSMLEPGLVKLDCLPGVAQAPANDPAGNSWGAHRHSPDDPLFGIFGEDPREYDDSSARRLLAATVGWLVATVQSARSESSDKRA